MSKILYQQPNGNLAIIIPTGNVSDAVKDVPSTIPYEIVADTDIPSDTTFFEAWEHDTSAAPEKVKTNMTKAKVIAHNIRRTSRDNLFKPLDIKTTIPVQAAQAEIDRQAIRDSDAIVQTDIDAAVDESTLKAILTTATYL